MPLSLRTDVSYCRVDDQLFILDLKAGRYSQLSASAVIAFRRILASEEHDPGDLEVLRPLVVAGLLVETSRARPATEISLLTPATVSLLESVGRTPDAFNVSAALGMYVWVSIRLRLLGLRRVLASLSCRKAQAMARTAVRPGLEAADMAAAFTALDNLIGRGDRCLPRSIALTCRLFDRGFIPDLIFGVSGRPFNAHCWVQIEDVLVSDRLEHVRDYTPILII